jgi:hypothetical protein
MGARGVLSQGGLPEDGGARVLRDEVRARGGRFGARLPRRRRRYRGACSVWIGRRVSVSRSTQGPRDALRRQLRHLGPARPLAAPRAGRLHRRSAGGHRAGHRLRRCRDQDRHSPRRRRLGDQRLEALHHQRGVGRLRRGRGQVGPGSRPRRHHAVRRGGRLSRLLGAQDPDARLALGADGRAVLRRGSYPRLASTGRGRQRVHRHHETSRGSDW